ncbi:MAG: cation:proton antiporter [Anaerolineales bacterium]|nr:cation:proton antiporter [Anaerolineales bacterium]MCS7248727.1 cation:proton antiporter [Anaerolineales bacterium]MDW8162540.1 cation:proton antiporter [Anaerolineales bacterium]MDW8447531.1 cation:proton antiporter [Anaerolineales bacterium]
MILWLTVALLIAAVLLCLYRVARGPSLPDRVVGLDLLSSVTVGFIAVYAVISGEIIYIDVATVLALIAFLGTVAFAYFIEKGGMPWRKT